MMDSFSTAEFILGEFKGNTYLHGLGVLPQVGRVAAELGKRVAMIVDQFPGSEGFISQIMDALSKEGIESVIEIAGARPNAPREDIFRITDALLVSNFDFLLSFGGGSTIDATKAAEVLRSLNGDIDLYFGMGLVSQALVKSSKVLKPHVAIQTAASSAAHMTKYSNITDLKTGQKKLIIDEVIVPQRPIFDYSVTLDSPHHLTLDGALDGISHSLEVLYSAVGKPNYTWIEKVAKESIRLIVSYLPLVLENPKNPEGREALGLATDLGGYAIMLGGTNGAHLTSFSLVDLLSHGRACGMLNPYYTVFFAPAIEKPLKMIGDIYKDAGFTNADIDALGGRQLGIVVANAMIEFERRIGFPVSLSEVPGFSDEYINRALIAAKDPQLKMKLDNMPVPLTAEMVDEYMGPILLAAKTGDLNLIKNVP
jgi:alcohol dehydrogenase class IV